MFDTWFTSSLTPQIASGWWLRPESHARLFPMDLRPQSHEIIRTWAFYTIAKALLHEDQIPWRHVGISGWVLDPDRKKMSKSKGNVLTPMHLLDTYGSDAVRYWAAGAKLGADTAFDEKVLKVGRRLVLKLFNASKLVLSMSGPDLPPSCPLDLGFLVRLRELVERASRQMNDFEFATALDEIERFFWGSFTDTYAELVKNRARSEDDPEGRGSAVGALQIGLKSLLRLFAPFLPYITEECWSWGYAAQRASPRSTARPGRPWPSCRASTATGPTSTRPWRRCRRCTAPRRRPAPPSAARSRSCGWPPARPRPGACRACCPTCCPRPGSSATSSRPARAWPTTWSRWSR